jgi:hypothetical protein
VGPKNNHINVGLGNDYGYDYDFVNIRSCLFFLKFLLLSRLSSYFKILVSLYFSMNMNGLNSDLNSMYPFSVCKIIE